jgi:hypothetical protein
VKADGSVPENVEMLKLVISDLAISKNKASETPSKVLPDFFSIARHLAGKVEMSISLVKQN